MTTGSSHPLSVGGVIDAIGFISSAFQIVTAPPYNADPTGSVSASTAIQAALDAAYTAGGGTVFVPAGTYKLTAALVVRDKVTLQGAGRGATTFILSGWSATSPWQITIGGYANFTAITTYQGAADVAMYNFTVNQGSVHLGVFAAIVSGNESKYQTIENVEIINSGESGAGIGLMGGIAGSECIFGRISNCKVVGIAPSAGSGGIIICGYGHVVSCCHVENTSDEGIVCNGSSTDAHFSTLNAISNNTVKGNPSCGACIHIESSSEVSVANNIIHGNGSPNGIFLFPPNDAQYTGRCSISGNIVHGCATGIICTSLNGGGSQTVTCLTDVSISGNTVSFCTQDGILVGPWGETLTGTGSVTISNNVISNCSSAGDFSGILITSEVTQTDGVSIMGNTINHCGPAGGGGLSAAIRFKTMTASLPPPRNVSVIGNVCGDKGTAMYKVTAATNASPIVLTLDRVTGLVANSSLIYIAGIQGNTAANSFAYGQFKVGNIVGNTIQLLHRDGSNTTGNGAYVTGGVVIFGMVQTFGIAVCNSSNGALSAAQYPDNWIITGNQFSGNISYNSIELMGVPALSSFPNSTFAKNVTDDSGTNML
jgi:hypothetical protein